MKITDSIVLAEAAINQDSIITLIGNLIVIAQVIGVAVAVLSAIFGVILSLFASERTKETWYGRAKMAFVIAALVAAIPQLIKWMLTVLGYGDKYKLNALGALAKEMAISPLATLKSLL
ncbi:hypothetical protein [Lactococcus lactis]|uniref:ABC transmembrane type-1 domain-containing protein n=1 Tax=Lactococcus lactis TaxID=1358 RepID=A0AAW8UIG5_9LACT|nr:hypothetical protein [Lactococcus lactis]MDT2882394.1 hypothetical protein [Lactococcus lactis]MDT2946944.1 hypothetical protein [Lactococcus lactis]